MAVYGLSLSENRMYICKNKMFVGYVDIICLGA